MTCIPFLGIIQYQMASQRSILRAAMGIPPKTSMHRQWVIDGDPGTLREENAERNLDRQRGDENGMYVVNSKYMGNTDPKLSVPAAIVHRDFVVESMGLVGSPTFSRIDICS